MRWDFMFIPVGDHKESLCHCVKAVCSVPVTHYHCFVCIQNTAHQPDVNSTPKAPAGIIEQHGIQ